MRGSHLLFQRELAQETEEAKARLRWTEEWLVTEEVEAAILVLSRCLDMKERIEIGWLEEGMQSKPNCGDFFNWKRFECVQMLLSRQEQKGRDCGQRQGQITQMVLQMQEKGDEGLATTYQALTGPGLLCKVLYLCQLTDFNSQRFIAITQIGKQAEKLRKLPKFPE